MIFIIQHISFQSAKLGLLLTRHAWFISFIIIMVKECSLASVMAVVIVPCMPTIPFRQVFTRKACLSFTWQHIFKTYNSMYINQVLKVPNETIHEWRSKLSTAAYLRQFRSMEWIITMSGASDLSLKYLFHGHRLSRSFRRSTKLSI